MTEARIKALVTQWDPLFESLVGGAPEDRAAIWGQAEQESNDDPGAVEKPGTNFGGIGLDQWTASRRSGLMAFAASMKRPWQDAEVQVRFMGKELTGAYAHVWHQITKVATTLQSKTETAMGLYEAPADWKEEIAKPGSTTAGLPRRLRGAQWALEAINELKGTKMTDTSGTAAAPAPAPQQSAVDALSAFIKREEVTVEDLAKAWLISKGIPGFIPDLIFKQINQIDIAQLLQHVDWESIIVKLFNKK